MLFWQRKEEGVESSILKMCDFTPNVVTTRDA